MLPADHLAIEIRVQFRARPDTPSGCLDLHPVVCLDAARVRGVRVQFDLRITREPTKTRQPAMLRLSQNFESDIADVEGAAQLNTTDSGP